MHTGILCSFSVARMYLRCRTSLVQQALNIFSLASSAGSFLFLNIHIMQPEIEERELKKTKKVLTTNIYN